MEQQTIVVVTDVEQANTFLFLVIRALNCSTLVTTFINNIIVRI